ncbi:MAG: MetQ/NlpA family ABC transporter substrate-binding protein [Lachnospiraceae bacterium]|nr:MetQ/NlpA family ABC transporter substrate-binding protein [Lachnospiraceae bacterium]
MRKGILTAVIFLALAVIILLFIGGCGRNERNEITADADGITTLRVGATPSPHAEILEFLVDYLAAENINLVITEFTDFVLPNMALDGNDIDANFFQHTPFMDTFNEDRDTHIVAVGKIHYEPMGIYPGRSDSLENIQEGASIAVPNDVTNGARALLLLEAQGLITLDPDAGLLATTRDIVDNPLNLTITEMDAAGIGRALPDVDFAVLNGNFALQAGLTVRHDALAIEDKTSIAAETYANVLAVNAGNENNEAVLRLLQAMQSEKVRAFIEEKYDGGVVPVF